ncbi:hypothetical protein HRU45_02130 [Candidatus Dependentiae bacterium]|nr:hypothetical protein [Candidatus Dependentiae bacterium]
MNKHKITGRIITLYSMVILCVLAVCDTHEPHVHIEYDWKKETICERNIRA